MENPLLTFVTPSIIAGDKSLTDTVAHEISHSWFGNLVTNNNWGDFWVNEGFTMFAERRIQEELYGKVFIIVIIINIILYIRHQKNYLLSHVSQVIFVY